MFSFDLLQAQLSVASQDSWGRTRVRLFRYRLSTHVVRVLTLQRNEEEMPTYEYACKQCGEHLEVVQSFHDDALTECHNCGGELKKVFGNIGIVFKGSGFYKTDSRSTSSGAKASSSDGAEGSSTEPKADSSKPETSKDSAKSESKTESKPDSSTPTSPKSQPAPVTSPAAAAS